jgi:type III secretory pathway component EscT
MARPIPFFLLVPVTNATVVPLMLKVGMLLLVAVLVVNVGGFVCFVVILIL